MNRIAKHVVFRGHVQGVGFRYTTHRIAGRYDLTGFVRNCSDGTVEMLVQGPGEEVDACLQDIQGAFAGDIRNTQTTDLPYTAGYDSFRIMY